MVTTIDTAGTRRIEEAAREVVQTLLGTSYTDLVELARAQNLSEFYGSVYVQVQAALTHVWAAAARRHRGVDDSA